ncbi:MAG: diphosphomevalonate decarboxylase [Saprospiraceae bacterium]|nr:diphosphomevalonate decarboxylase [Saprospiraceae bacterium]
MYENPRLILDSDEAPEPGRIVWRSPSNLAIIKYWGKYGAQMPRNPSLSLTLSASCTDMALEYSLKEVPDSRIGLGFLFHGEENAAFQAKIQAFLESLVPVFPFLTQLQMSIQTGNSFPHSAGIASSASSMSALALCLCSLEDALFGTLQEPAEFDRKSSFIARLGSGSACRSIFPHAAVWGASAAVPDSSDAYAVPAEHLLHPGFKDLHDDILIVSSQEKSVSSRAGHALMEGNPYAEARYAQAKSRLSTLIDALGAGDWEAFGKIAEDEALTLHALMMCSNPSYMLLEPNTIALIQKIRAYRAETKHPVYFSLDAGPNIHLLYPGEIIAEVRGWIEEELTPLLVDNWFIQDWVGEGPEEL